MPWSHLCGQWYVNIVFYTCACAYDNAQLDVFLTLVTSATEVGNTRPSRSSPESVARIHEVCFYSLTSSTWDDLSAADALPSPDTMNMVITRDPYNQTASSPPVFEDPCLPF